MQVPCNIHLRSSTDIPEQSCAAAQSTQPLPPTSARTSSSWRCKEGVSVQRPESAQRSADMQRKGQQQEVSSRTGWNAYLLSADYAKQTSWFLWLQSRLSQLDILFMCNSYWHIHSLQISQSSSPAVLAWWVLNADASQNQLSSSKES